MIGSRLSVMFMREQISYKMIILNDCTALRDVKQRTNELVNLAFSTSHKGISVWPSGLTPLRLPVRVKPMEWYFFPVSFIDWVGCRNWMGCKESHRRTDDFWSNFKCNELCEVHCHDCFVNRGKKQYLKDEKILPSWKCSADLQWKQLS